jgi:hypothetical protein
MPAVGSLLIRRSRFALPHELFPLSRAFEHQRMTWSAVFTIAKAIQVCILWDSLFEHDARP